MRKSAQSDRTDAFIDPSTRAWMEGAEERARERYRALLLMLSWDRSYTEQDIIQKLREGDDLLFSRFLKFGTWLDVPTFWKYEEFRNLFREWLERRKKGEKPSYNVPAKRIKTWKALLGL